MTAIKLYRIAHKLYIKHIPILPKVFYRLIYLLNNCHLHYETEIGEGTKIAYGGIGVVIHKNAVIGRNCVIESNVTIGGRNNDRNVPVIGNNVLIGTGARILGNVHIGDKSIIGANAVVIHDVPACCSAAGIPAKILHCNIKIEEKCNLLDIINN
jgi:serine O-acetyltransferase